MIKRLVILICICISISVKILGAYDYTKFEFNWDNTIINVPIGSNIRDYEDIPKVTVSIEGIPYNCSIVKGDTPTWRDTISVNVIGTYHTTYEAVYTYQNVTLSNKQQITFIVEDNESPVISATQKEIVINYKEKVDYKRYLKISDNQTDVKDLIISPNDGHVDTNIIGTYDVIVDVFDSSNNVTSINFTVIVVDKVAPIIKHDPIVLIESCEHFEVKDYFTGYDEYDKDVSSNLTYDEFDSKTLGRKTITLYLHDTSGNKTTKDVVVEVVDNTNPIIELTVNEVILSIKEVYEDEYFKKYIKSLSDNGYILDNNLVKVDLSNLFYEIGNHKVVYYYVDNSGNETTNIMYVTLKNFDGPIIIAPDVTIEVGYNFDYKNYVVVEDPYDLNAANTLELIEYGLDINTPGTYQIIVKAYNNSAVITTKTFLVTVKGKELDKNLDLYEYWPIGLIGLIFVGYFCYISYQKYLSKKFN